MTDLPIAIELNRAMARVHETGPVDPVEACVAATSVVTAYLERIANPERRAALAEGLAQMIVESAQDGLVLQTPKPVKSAPRRKLL